jgi:hypothetical protein
LEATTATTDEGCAVGFARRGFPGSSEGVSGDDLDCGRCCGGRLEEFPAGRFIQRAGKSMSLIPWHAVKGNHDNRKWSTFSHWFDNAFADNLDEDFYSFMVGDIQFIGLNTEGYKVPISQGLA